MRQLGLPAHDPIETFDQAVDEISDAVLRGTFIANKGHVVAANAAFDQASGLAAWANLPRAPHGSPNHAVAGALTKQQFRDLYTKCLVGSKRAARDIYDSILTAANGICPLCGGLGHVATLDHFLPKAYFPVYSVHPQNLVPCCRDCNTGKNAGFGTGVNEQALHPYFDAPHFFSERWVRAQVERVMPLLVRYRCSPPPHWSQTDKDRALAHFNGYQIGRRFSLQAGSEVANVINLRRKTLFSLSEVEFRSYLSDCADNPGPDLNGWSRTLYRALAESPWFAAEDFRQTCWD